VPIPEPPLAPPATRRESLRVALLVVGAWTAMALLSAVQWSVKYAEKGGTVHWGENLRVSFVAWWGCLPVLPLLAWATRRAPLGRGTWLRHGALLLGAVAVAAVAREVVLEPLLRPLHGMPGLPWPSATRVISNALLYLGVVAALHAVVYYRRLRAQEVEAARLARRLAETQLAALRAQLQPHFLFNTLNAISALLHDEPDVADRMLTRLADLLREVLDPPPGDEHALADELAVLDRYLEIAALRFGPRLTLEVSVAPEARTGLVPWLVLQPLVENALEHGAGRRRGGVHVRITAVRLTDAAGAERLALEVCDDGPGPRAGGGEARRGHGIGLENTRRRLAQLHGDGASLSLAALPAGGACARIELPWRPAPTVRHTGEHARPAALPTVPAQPALRVDGVARLVPAGPPPGAVGAAR
jgi:hypothetical protein